MLYSTSLKFIIIPIVADSVTAVQDYPAGPREQAFNKVLWTAAVTLLSGTFDQAFPGAHPIIPSPAGAPGQPCSGPPTPDQPSPLHSRPAPASSAPEAAPIRLI